jgi:hypothetical protein
MDFLPVPRDAFEQFQAALRRESKRLIADCAEFLRVSPQELQKEVQEKLKGSPIQVALLETDEHPGCLAFLKEDTFAYRCRSPPLTNTKFCDKHQTCRLVVNTTKSRKLTRLAPKDDLPPLWVDRQTQLVYNVKQQAVGTFDASLGCLKLYVIQE